MRHLGDFADDILVDRHQMRPAPDVDVEVYLWHLVPVVAHVVGVEELYELVD